MHVATFKGYITRPIKTEVNIVTMLVTKILRQLLTNQIGPLSSVLNREKFQLPESSNTRDLSQK